MSTEKLRKRLLACSMALSLMPGICWGYGTNYRSATGFPSQITGFNSASAEVQYVIYCYNAYNGELLDCPLTSSILGLAEPTNETDNNGGHSHDNPGREFGKLKYRSTQGAQISASTANDIAIVTQYLPQFGGKIVNRIDVNMPVSGGWRCLDSPAMPCLDVNTARYDTTVDVKVPRLVRLPDDSATYLKIRGAGSQKTHTNADAYYGLPVANQSLAQIAKLFKKIAGELLSINDMSLPKGGKFDWKADWIGAHGEHRIGLSADINRRIKSNGEPMPCLDNAELQRAVDLVIPPNPPRAFVNVNATGRTMSRLYCEPTTFQHIDFDGIPVLSN